MGALPGDERKGFQTTIQVRKQYIKYKYMNSVLFVYHFCTCLKRCALYECSFAESSGFFVSFYWIHHDLLQLHHDLLQPEDTPKNWANYNDQTRRLVTLNGGLVMESPKNPLNSGLGIILICPEKTMGFLPFVCRFSNSARQ